MKKYYFPLIIFCFLVQACSIGQSRSFCEKEGCDYRKAGICNSAFDIFADRRGTIAEAYRNTPCKK
ncbi:hypothetical protein [Helicobacter equorum]|uniref:Lipoprotein n=1 Tax=Helicobacter equorum TaxID=361872 RepID=A0A3D8INC9_9HELI|nr:hypothetical protein [Helicobacter equorum]RDU66435.1 hypothetical protein CQA54_06975 [Helicobacter equorum]